MRKRVMRIFCLAVSAAVLSAATAYAMDEAVLTPTKGEVVASEDKEFNDAMKIWFKHRYSDGEKLLRQFSKKYPDSRWAAEADLHVGCYLTFNERYGEARSVFDEIIKKHGKTTMGAKATIRLGNVAEAEGKTDEAIQHYTDALKMDVQMDQFKYANFNARKLIMTRGKRLAHVNCGPVALAACLNAVDKTSAAEAARAIKVSEDGISLARLSMEAESLGVHTEAVELSLAQLKTAELPLLLHLNPNHFAAVLGVSDGMVSLIDSVHGKRKLPLERLEQAWSGKALAFGPALGLTRMSSVTAMNTNGGCCGQAAESECLGDPEDCQAAGNCPDDCYPCGGRSPGSPTWWVNTNNLNLLARDTPIWYDPGEGPDIAFTLTYSNENSNTGIFGPGWRCHYDMRVFFLPAGANPTLQLHRGTGRIETYEWNGTGYEPRSSMADYGYRDTISMDNGVVTLNLEQGGKYKFVEMNAVAGGRIQYIYDAVGKYVTCNYNGSGNLISVVDANNRTTTMATMGSGLSERVTQVTLPDNRHAHFAYTDGYLTSITDMGDSESTFAYDFLQWSGSSDYTTLTHSISPTNPANGGNLYVGSTNPFPPSGVVKISIDDGPTIETIGYTGKGKDTSEVWLSMVSRQSPQSVDAGARVAMIRLPYLSRITTPSRKNVFSYEWWTFDGSARTVVALHQVHEFGPNEAIDTSGPPTIHYSWCSATNSEYTNVTRYPQSVTPESDGCTTHWTGGLTKVYGFGPLEDALCKIEFPAGRRVVEYTYNGDRDRITSKDGNDHTSRYYYDAHKLTKVADPMTAEPSWTSEYVYYSGTNLIYKEKDSHGNEIKTYTYDTSTRQLTKIEVNPSGTQVQTQLTNNYIDGKLVSSVDGRLQTTSYHYNEDGETRGFLTSIEDPNGHRTRFHYDTKGRRDSVTDADNKTVTYEFDDLDRVTKVFNPDGTYVETTYSCCHILSVRDENGKVTANEYDKKNRLWLTLIDPRNANLNGYITSSATNLQLTDTTGFPASGYLLLKSPNGLTVEIVKYSALNGTTLSGLTRAQMGTTASAFTSGATSIQGLMAVTVYDSVILDRKVGFYDADGHLTQYEYEGQDTPTNYADDSSRLVKTIYPDDSYEKYTYDNVGNLTEKENGKGSTIIKTVKYKYDANDRLIGTE